jgi:hypothetical protein
MDFLYILVNSTPSTGFRQNGDGRPNGFHLHWYKLRNSTNRAYIEFICPRAAGCPLPVIQKWVYHSEYWKGLPSGRGQTLNGSGQSCTLRSPLARSWRYPLPLFDQFGRWNCDIAVISRSPTSAPLLSCFQSWCWDYFPSSILTFIVIPISHLSEIQSLD